MDKMLYEKLSKRLQKVEHRLKAIDTEQDFLIKEKEAISKLLPIYKTMIDTYDPIEEERRMSGIVTSFADNHKNKVTKKESKYAAIFQEIFEIAKKPLNLTELQDYFELLEIPTTYSNLTSAIYRAVKTGKMLRPKPAQYIWKGL